MPLDSHHIVLQSLGWIWLTVNLACFHAEPAEPLREQRMIVCQQNVRGTLSLGKHRFLASPQLWKCRKIRGYRSVA